MSTAAFKVKQSTLTTGSQELRQYRNTLRSVQSSVGQARCVLNGMQGGISRVCVNLSKLENGIGRCAENTGSMAGVLGDIAGLYGKTEQMLTKSIGNSTKAQGNSFAMGDAESGKEKGFLDHIWEWICGLFGWGGESDEGEYEIDSVVFDDTGDYGGDQGVPVSLDEHAPGRQQLYDIVRRHFPEMSDTEIRVYLSKLNSEGCSYVATINTIFAAYEGREKEFEKTFGIPMYKNGDLNYNELLVDFYCETDNHNKGIFGIDYVDNSEDESTSKGSGATRNQQRYRAEKYLREKGVEVEISNKNITVDNFKEYSKDGYVVLDYFNGPLQREDGSSAGNIGGHAMTITGVTNDGRYIVSSWGEKYYIDPRQGKCEYIYFQYK